MSVRSWAPGRKCSDPRGMWASLTNRRAGTPSRAFAMQNMRIAFGTTRTRSGTSGLFTTTGSVTGMFNWIEPDGTNLLLYQDVAQIKTYRQDTNAIASLFAVPGNTRAPVFCPLDVWNYICGYDTAGNGTFQVRIFDGTNVDKAFRAPPVITSWTTADAGPGQCTAGEHLFGFVYQNRTGYAGVPVTTISFAITATSNANPDVITAPGNNLQTGQTVLIAGATGDTAINGTRIVTVLVAGSTFTLTDTALTPIAGNGAYTGGGVVTNPIKINLTAGLRQVNITVGLPAQPDGGTSANGGVQAKLFLIATRSDNPGIWYFIPSDANTAQIGEVPVPLNTAAVLGFRFNISDEDIASQLAGDTAQANFLFLAQDAAGNGPFNPNFVVAYGNRMCYGAGTTVYISDIGFPQQIAADTNGVRMQNQKAIGAAFQLPGNTNIYLTGDRWTGYTTDNGDSPSTWPQPIGVSDTLGAPFQNCVCAATGGNWAWIVTEAGPYLFDGAYGMVPLTYLSSGENTQKQPIGWSRVNWAAAYTIQIRDDTTAMKLYIAVPMDGAIEPNYVFVIDYRLGKTFDTVDIGLDKYGWGSLTSICVVKELATGLNNLWLSPLTLRSTVRLDASVRNDTGFAIDGYWTSGFCRGPNIVASMLRVGAMDIWAHGEAPLDENGEPTFLITLFGPDGVESVPVTLLSTQGVPAALTTAPGITYMAKLDASKLNNYFVQFRTNRVDAWQELSGFVCYEKSDLFNR